mmetsp:Transcript_15830/g.37903  ORF Transcript_15830/g.37903 Transcript_15830/m.37903 type:complete len:369 (+) Transcript_15830:97-1203(+)|eukprot:CAMPEP_0113279104 /NCGR_PEP_ID=MMETSP0008_2-20120614/26984_1 /TAXON_ID=97485 /ORGANISM="Prymnesium parvum" /LENGTH=368 /DNA_ID=CAMNT_0000129221 /DNA_START=41 /DNA_END=1147 /DNA_ORIENTATION=+ /assembly_acc=CAM_ASM_000153
MSLLTASFNQDHTHLAVGTALGWKIFSCDPFACRTSSSQSGVSCIQMLFSSALVALVGAGERPGDSQRKLRLWNTYTETAVGPELSFPTTVLSVQMNRQRLVVVLESALHIFDLMSMQHLHTLPTSRNPRGLAALCTDEEVYHCATLTADGKDGHVIMYDVRTMHTLNTVAAHRSTLHCLSLSSRGDMLATASEKGTVVRVHSFPQGSLLYTFRRGNLRSTIHSVSFSPTSPMAVEDNQRIGGVARGCALLCAASSTTVHVWQLDAQRGAPDIRESFSSPQNAAPWAGWLPAPAERDFAFVRLKVAPGTRCFAAICASNSQVDTERKGHYSLFIVSDRGSWLSYKLDPLRGGECKLLDERRLLSPGER